LSSVPRLPGLDGRAMHTSYGNAILLKDSPEETSRKVMSMFTDPTRIHATDPGHVEGNPVFTYLDVFDPDLDEVEALKEQYRVGEVGDVVVKARLAGILNEYLAPLRHRLVDYTVRRNELMEILAMGTEAVRPIALATLEEVECKMGLDCSKLLAAQRSQNSRR